MSPAITLARRELRHLFASPIAYVFIAVFLSLSFWLFFSNVFLYAQANLRPFFDMLPLLFIIFLPSITMGMWSEEKRSGTHEILLTLPVSRVQLLLGKWLAAVGFLLVVLFFTIPLPVTISLLGDLDAGQVLANYCGAFLMGCAYLAFGLFVSSMARNQIVSFLITVLVLFVFFILAAPVVTDFLPRALTPWAQFFAIGTHFQGMARGVIDLRDVVYFLSFTGLSLYLNALSLKFL